MIELDGILKDIMNQLPGDGYVRLINKMPYSFFKLNLGRRIEIMKEIRHLIIRDGNNDPEALAELVRQRVEQVVNVSASG